MSSFYPKVSVMIITYNQEDLIAETIESVLAQDYKNLEIVVSDDASTDKTPEIVESFAARYPGKIIPVLNKFNLGITGNSNSAFFTCTGELIAVLGGDDLFLPGKISKQVKLFEDNDVVLSYHQVEIFLHQTGKILFTTNTTRNEIINDAYEIISKGGIPGASSVMVRRSACPEHGFDPQFPVVSDWIFYIEVAMRGRIARLDGVFGRYRKHGKGASDRTYELLSESLQTLDVIQARYPSDLKLKKACEKGAYRYLMGELFRQVLKEDKEKIKYITKLMLDKSRGLKYLFTLFFLGLSKFDSAIKVMAIVFDNFKNFLKRII